MIIIIIYNFPIKIKYDNFIFYLFRKNHLLDGKEFTQICKHTQKNTGSNKYLTKFCNGKIKGIRDTTNFKKFEFYLVSFGKLYQF